MMWQPGLFAVLRGPCAGVLCVCGGGDLCPCRSRPLGEWAGHLWSVREDTQDLNACPSLGKSVKYVFMYFCWVTTCVGRHCHRYDPYILKCCMRTLTVPPVTSGNERSVCGLSIVGDTRGASPGMRLFPSRSHHPRRTFEVQILVHRLIIRTQTKWLSFEHVLKLTVSEIILSNPPPLTPASALQVIMGVRAVGFDHQLQVQ